AGETTESVYLRFHLVSSSLISYLSFAVLPNGPSSLTRPVISDVDTADYDSLLTAIPSDVERWQKDEARAQIKDFLHKFPMPPSPVPGGTDIVAGWHAQILRDYELMRLPLVLGDPTLNPVKTRNPVYGFMDLPLAVV